MIKKLWCKIFGHKLFKSLHGQDEIQRYGYYLHCQHCGEKIVKIEDVKKAIWYNYQKNHDEWYD